MAQAPFLALITPIGATAPPGPVDPGYSPPWAQVPPGHIPGGPVDPGYSPPWAQVPPGTTPPVQPPLGIWGPPQMPPGFWGGGMGPGVKPQPRPEHPIYFPPEGGEPPLGIWGPPQMPPGFWGGGMGPGVKPQPRPEHPIVLPPDLPPVIPPEGERPEMPIDWKPAWTPETGWIVVGIPQFPHVTPSR